ncbi:hypothetical protein [Streptomyces sp. col6]
MGTTQRVPARAKAARRTGASVAYETTPEEVSRARSRRARSSGGTSPGSS